MVDRVLMVSTITPASASQDLLEIAARLVRLLFVINNQYYSIQSFFGLQNHIHVTKHFLFFILMFPKKV